MPRPRSHDEETREALLLHAGRALARDGLAAVSVRRVSDDAGVSTRAVYSLFESKEGLLRAMYHDGFATLKQRTESVPRTEDPLRDIRALADAYRTSALTNRHLYGLMFDRLPGWVPSDEDRRGARRTLRPLGEAVARAAAKGFLPPDVQAVTLQLWSLVHGLASLELAGDLGPPSAAASHWDQAVTATLRGYHPEDNDGTNSGRTRKPPK